MLVLLVTFDLQPRVWRAHSERAFPLLDWGPMPIRAISEGRSRARFQQGTLARMAAAIFRTPSIGEGFPEPSVKRPARGCANNVRVSSPTIRHKPLALWELLGRVRAGARRLESREALAALVRTYRDNDLLTYASAIAFQVLFALVPLLLFSLGVLGFLHLQSVWQTDIAPGIRPNVSSSAFTLIDRTVTEILDKRQIFWLTLGGFIAVWEISGAMRAVMQVFNRIYGVEQEDRPFARRLLISFALAATSGVLVIACFAIARFGPLLVTALLGHSVLLSVASLLVRWGIVVALLLVLVGVLVRHAPCCARPLEWVSFGALLVVFSWLAMSLAFSWYLGSIADYGSVFGSLATLIVTMEYLYMSAIVFLTGVQIDALVRGAIEPHHGLAAV